jgi:hypothetical protein
VTRRAEPCHEGWESADPGAGSFSPNPCVRCEWSQADHANREAQQRVEQLERFAMHTPECKKWHKPLGWTGYGVLSEETPCTCGLSALLTVPK